MNIANNLFYIIPSSAALCNLFLLLTFMSAKKDKLMRSFMWLLITFTAWPLGSLFMRMGLYPGVAFWFQVSMISILFVPVCIYNFLYHYTSKRGRFLLFVFHIGSVILAILNIFDAFVTNPRIVVLENGQQGFSFGLSLFAVVPVAFSAWVLACAAKMIYTSIKNDGFPAATFRPFFIGILIMVAAIILDMVPGLSALFPVDPFACMINAILIYYMLYKKHVFTMTQFASNGSTYLISTVLTGLIQLSAFSFINEIFDRYFGRFEEYQTLLLAIFFSIMTIVIFNLLKILMNNLFVKGEQAKEVVVKEFSLAISKTLNRDEIMELFIDLLREQTHVENAYVFVYDKTENNYHVRACTDKMKSMGSVIHADSPLIRWLMDHKESIKYSDFKHTTNYKSMWDTEKNAFEILHAEYILPIICDEELIGLTIISDKQNKKSYAYSEISFLESVSSIVSIAIKNADLYETIQEEARMDSLTTIYNRRHFSEEFERIFRENIQNSITLILISFDDFKLYNELYGSNDGDEILKKFSSILKTTIGSRGIIGRYSGKEFCICLPMCSSKEAELVVEQIRQSLRDTLNSSRETTKKFLTFSAGICSYPISASSSKQMFTYANMAVYACKKSGKNKTIVYSQRHESESNHLSYKNMEAIAQEYAPTIYALTAAIDAKDHYTFSHSENVSYLATVLAQAIGLEAEHVEMIRQAGLLHDIGKISIPEAILTKTSRLTDDEYTTMKTHVESSIAMIRHLPSLDYVIPIAISHHERYDGKGYPRGLAGEDIPVGGRCLGVADAFDAIVSRRPYKNPVSIPEALDEIERNLGKQFDPVIGRTFIDLVKNHKINLDIYH